MDLVECRWQKRSIISILRALEAQLVGKRDPLVLGWKYECMIVGIRATTPSLSLERSSSTAAFDWAQD
jgi:hypothetical protein